MPLDATRDTDDSTMTQRETLESNVSENDLLIRRSRVRNPPGSLELRPRDEPGVRGIVRDRPLLCRGADVQRNVIYGLIDPLEPARVRYVGKASNPAARLADHIRNCFGPSKKERWIAEMVVAGRLPDMVLIEAGDDYDALDERERYWICAHRENGDADLNTTIPRDPRIDAVLAANVAARAARPRRTADDVFASVASRRLPARKR